MANHKLGFRAINEAAKLVRESISKVDSSAFEKAKDEGKYVGVLKVPGNTPTDAYFYNGKTYYTDTGGLGHTYHAYNGKISLKALADKAT